MGHGIFPELKFLNDLFPEWYFSGKSVNPKLLFPNAFFPTVIVPEIEKKI